MASVPKLYPSRFVRSVTGFLQVLATLLLIIIGVSFNRVPSSPMESEIVEFVIDCDSESVDLALNSILCWANVRGAENAAREVTVLCLGDAFESSCCAFFQRLGFRTLGYGDDIEIHRLSKTAFESSGPSIAHLDSVQLYRELAYSQLLMNSKKLLVRSDADSCFVADPLQAFADTSLDFLISAQHEQKPFWSYDWACSSAERKVNELTLNGGIQIIQGSTAVSKHLASMFGIGLFVLAGGKTSVGDSVHDPDGWSQKGMNIHFDRLGLCFERSESSGSLIRSQGSTRHEEFFPQVKVGIFTNVCSPCQPGFCTPAEEVVTVHANCVLISDKKKFLQSADAWRLRSDWRNFTSSALVLRLEMPRLLEQLVDTFPKR